MFAAMLTNDDALILAAFRRSQAIIEFDLNGIILTANENFLGAVGYTLAEIKGKHHSIFVDEIERESAAYKQFWAGLRAGHLPTQSFQARR